MKKVISLMCAMLIAFSLSGCGGSDYTLSYESGKEETVADIDCVVIYTKFTNGGSESICAADALELKAYQNGTELSPIVPTGQKTDGYIQCDTNVQSGTTADVAWIFQLDDRSEVSVELPDGSKETISLE